MKVGIQNLRLDTGSDPEHEHPRCWSEWLEVSRITDE